MIEIRELTLDDFDNLQLINSIYGIKSFVNQEMSMSKIKEIFEFKRTTTDTFIVVDTNENKIVGHAAVNVHYSFNGGRVGILYDVAINPKYQGKGIGLDLIFYARDKCGTNHNLTRLCGPVTPDIAPFYEKIGGKRDLNVDVYQYCYPNKQVKSML